MHTRRLWSDLVVCKSSPPAASSNSPSVDTTWPDTPVERKRHGEYRGHRLQESRPAWRRRGSLNPTSPGGQAPPALYWLVDEGNERLAPWPAMCRHRE